MEKVKIGWSSCEAVKRSGQVVALVQVKLQNWLQSLKLFDCGARKVIIIWRATQIIFYERPQEYYLQTFLSRRDGWHKDGAGREPEGIKHRLMGKWPAPQATNASAFVQRLV